MPDMYGNDTPEEMQRRKDAASAGYGTVSTGYLYGVGQKHGANSLAQQANSFYNGGSNPAPGSTYGNTQNDALAAQQWGNWANTMQQNFGTGKPLDQLKTLSDQQGSTSPLSQGNLYTGFGGSNISAPRQQNMQMPGREASQLSSTGMPQYSQGLPTTGPSQTQQNGHVANYYAGPTAPTVTRPVAPVFSPQPTTQPLPVVRPPVLPNLNTTLGGSKPVASPYTRPV
jgi:hypothetical protein